MDSAFEEMSVYDLSQRLKKALDSSYNVLNMQVVLEVLTCLEVRSDVSKEQVESTGLAISINNLRRKTNDDSLAKRSKRLVKEWRKMIPTNTSKSQPKISITSHLPIQTQKISSDITFIRNGVLGKRSHQRDEQHEVIHVKKQKKHKSSRREPMVTNIQNEEPYLISDSLSHDSTSLSFPSYQQPADKNKKLNFTGCFNSQVNPNVIKKEPQKLFLQTPHPTLSVSNSPDLDVYSITTSPIRSLNVSPETPPRTLSPVINHNQEATQISLSDLMQPKKRGRKKGSKSGGSLDIKDMIMKAGKKVKTTAELVYELGNRRSHKSQEQFVEHKKTSAVSKADSNSSTATVNSFCFKEEPMFKQKPNLPLTAADQLKQTTIEDEIRLLKAQLPPIDYSVLDDEENEVQIYNDQGQPVVCSCVFKEIVIVNEVAKDEGTSFIKVQTESEPDEFMNQDSDDEKSRVPLQVKLTKMKSIFDDDDDCDEDFSTIKIPAMFIENSDRNNNSVDKQLIKCEEQRSLNAEIENKFTAHETSTEEPQASTTTTWECVEDEKCIAANYFMQKTEFRTGQVQLLHDCFIPLVNGNWNGITMDECSDKSLSGVDLSKKLSGDYGLYKSVVPSCNHLEMEKLAKRSDVEDSGAGLNKLKTIRRSNNFMSSFSNLSSENWIGIDSDKNVEFKEFFNCMQVSSYEDEILNILPYVVID